MLWNIHKNSLCYHIISVITCLKIHIMCLKIFVFKFLASWSQEHFISTLCTLLKWVFNAEMITIQWWLQKTECYLVKMELIPDSTFEDKTTVCYGRALLILIKRFGHVYGSRCHLSCLMLWPLEFSCPCGIQSVFSRRLIFYIDLERSHAAQLIHGQSTEIIP